MSKQDDLDKFIKQLKEGIPFSDEFIEKSNDIYDNALLARNLTEDAVGREILKNTGVPIPGKEASRLKKEDFFNRLIKERYPEIEPDVRLEGSEDFYQKGKINLSDFTKQSPIETQVGTSMHEAAHQYDDQILDQYGNPLDKSSLRKAKAKGVDLAGKDPLQIYDEFIGSKHHAKIPKIRENSFGFSALKNLIKGNNFKSVPVIGPALGAAIAAASGDSNAASGLPILGEAEDIAIDQFSPQEEADREAASQLSSGEPLNTRRMLALKNILNK
jgi:hypothetical protein